MATPTIKPTGALPEREFDPLHRRHQQRGRDRPVNEWFQKDSLMVLALANRRMH
jgi:hypothetical protein